MIAPKTIKRKISPYLYNFRGWRTNRKIIVIESDDWGSIRMPSKKVYEKCLCKGYRVDEIAYERYDSLASNDDLELLFGLLLSFKGKNGSPPVITANALTANPDFEKIKSSGFREYHYELITDTFQRYPKHSGVFDLWNAGLNKGVFYPQSHGREHLNVSMFMEALQSGDKDLFFAFEEGMPGSLQIGSTHEGNKFVEALRFRNEKEKKEKLSIILEGLALFESLFGFKSESFIPPNYIWSPDFDSELYQRGVCYYQGNRKMKEPDMNGGFTIHSHYIGERNDVGQRYLVRNAIFEPSLFKLKIKDPVAQCLYQINAAFRMNKPAIICSHRINYVGYIDETNRDRNLSLLEELLKKILKRWPDIEFMTSPQLGNFIRSESE